MRDLNFNKKLLNISFSKNSIDGGIANSLKITNFLLNKSKFDSEWLTYDDIDRFKQYNFLKENLNSINKENALIHFHGLWRPHSRLRNLEGFNYVVSLHGMLMPSCARRSSLKKYISSKIWEEKFINDSKYLFALSINEALTIPNKYKYKKIIIFPNSVLMPKINNESKKLKPPWENDIKNKQKVLLFLSRFDSIKGIYLLVDAWKNLINTERQNDWFLAFIGYGDNGKLEKYINSLKSKNKIKNINAYSPVFGAMKDNCFRKADAFILPSLSEASPMAALEALSYGKPSIISEACGVFETARFLNRKSKLFSKMPYIECLSERKSIEKCLNQLFNLDDKLLNQLSFQSIEFINKNYNLENNLKDLVKIYCSIIENKKIPSRYLYNKFSS